MKSDPKFDKFLDAIKDILEGKPVDDLDTRIKEWDCMKSFRDGLLGPSDLKRLMAWSSYENRILQGEDPADMYGTPNYEEWQSRAQKFLKEFLDKYK